jgi:hypothetical protein
MTVYVVEVYDYYESYTIDSIYEDYDKAFEHAKQILIDKDFEGEEFENLLSELEDFGYCKEVAITAYPVKRG